MIVGYVQARDAAELEAMSRIVFESGGWTLGRQGLVLAAAWEPRAAAEAAEAFRGSPIRATLGLEGYDPLAGNAGALLNRSLLRDAVARARSLALGAGGAPGEVRCSEETTRRWPGLAGRATAPKPAPASPPKPPARLSAQAPQPPSRVPAQRSPAPAAFGGLEVVRGAIPVLDPAYAEARLELAPATLRTGLARVAGEKGEFRFTA